jgi:hypothetical protein
VRDELYTADITLSGRRIVLTAAAIGAANILALLGTYFHREVSVGLDWRIGYLTHQFNLTGENALVVWYASMLLLLVALAALACFLLDWRAADSRSERWKSVGWVLVAGVFVVLSIDELGSVHERLSSLKQLDPTGGRARGWVGPLLIPILAVGTFLFVFTWHVGRRSRAAAALLAGVVFFLTIPLQEQLEFMIKSRAAAMGAAAVRPTGWALLEEGTEVFGTLLFLLAALMYLRKRALSTKARASSSGAGEPVIRFRAQASTMRWTMAAAVGILFCGLVIFRFGFIPYFEQRPQWGNPLNWFPAALAFLAALIVIGAWLNQRRQLAGASVRRQFSSLYFAVLSLAISIDHGAAHVVSQGFWAVHPGQRVVIDLLLITAVVVAAGTLWLDSNSRPMRAAVVGWAILSCAAVAGPVSATVALSFGAYAILLPSLAQWAWLPRIATAKSLEGMVRADRATLHQSGGG